METLDAEIFVAIARTQNFGKASRKLFLSLSTISLRLKALEEELGVTLVRRGRGKRSAELTAIGKMFLPLAEQWVQLHFQIDKFRSSPSALSLTIGAINSANAYLLPPLYRILSMNHVQLNLSIKTQKTSDLYAMVQRGEVDIAIVYHPLSDPTLRVDPFLEEPFVLVSPSSPSEPGAAATFDPEAYVPEDEVYIHWSDSYAAWHDKWWKNRGFPRLRVDTCQLIGVFLTRPEQWAIVPWSVARYLQETHRCTLIPLAEEPPRRIYYLVQHIDALNLRGIELFRACAEIFRHGLSNPTGAQAESPGGYQLPMAPSLYAHTVLPEPSSQNDSSSGTL